MKTALAAIALHLVFLPGLAAEPPVPAAPARLMDAALASDTAYARLAWLCDRIGHRLSGSKALEAAVSWSAAEMRKDGLDRVYTDAVKVPKWVRGAETARIVAPVDLEMAVSALGMSAPTPVGGIEAEVVAVWSLDELTALGEKARGKIVLFMHAMERNGEGERGYGYASNMRWAGPVEAAKLGAKGALIRSLGTAHFRLPHTGTTNYEKGNARVPAAAIATEDADLIVRLLTAGETVRVRYTLGCREEGEADSANVIGEIRGREKPDEIVVLGAHLDSWDVGCGAHDDGAGVVAVMEAMRLIKSLGAPPRRTIRAVLFTNEENGLRGGRDYAARYKAQLDKHVAAIESDSGGARPLGFGVTAGAGGLDVVKALAEPLGVIDAADVRAGGGGADIGPMKAAGVPQMNLRQDSTFYFDYHHTKADTLDKVDAHDLRLNVAALAVMAYGLADLEGTLPRLDPSAEKAD
jgi:Zn-dependent M28 family amino/carboxypeptidase